MYLRILIHSSKLIYIACARWPLNYPIIGLIYRLIMTAFDFIPVPGALIPFSTLIPYSLFKDLERNFEVSFSTMLVISFSDIGHTVFINCHESIH
ncbi:hypothetical protein VNO78_01198 [Psophocarpus tetragonolobus]|uniref:Uncharacterized protein n=1 Tax=Psophocarpus tetragonolobus TaxID=3891 RepID=A0AAN9T064_PSOTE